MKVIMILLIFMNNANAFFESKCPIQKCGIPKDFANKKLKEFKSLLKDYKFSNDFLQETFDRLTISNPTYSKMEKFDSNFFYQSDRNGMCEPQHLKLLIERKIKIDKRHIAGLVRSSCKKGVELLLPKIDQKGLNKVSKIYYVPSNFTEKYQKKLMTVLQPIVLKQKEQCKKNDKLACDTLENFKTAITSYDKRYRQYNHSKTPEGKEQIHANEICDLKNSKAKYQSLISEERAKGQISGYVNAVKLKQWGDKVYKLGKEMNKTAKTYKANYKAEFNYKRCK